MNYALDVTFMLLVFLTWTISFFIDLIIEELRKCITINFQPPLLYVVCKQMKTEANHEKSNSRVQPEEYQETVALASYPFL